MTQLTAESSERRLGPEEHQAAPDQQTTGGKSKVTSYLWFKRNEAVWHMMFQQKQQAPDGIKVQRRTPPSTDDVGYYKLFAPAVDPEQQNMLFILDFDL